MPDTTELRRLTEQKAQQEEAFQEAIKTKEIKITTRKQTYDKTHPRYPAKEYEKELNLKVKKCRKTVNDTNVELLKLRLELQRQGSEHWPEILRYLGSRIDSNKKLDHFENCKQIQDKGRNSVQTATLNGVDVVLKAYDLLKSEANGGSTKEKVLEEVKQLQTMQHPNIIEVQDWFEHIARNTHQVIVQMPRYNDDLRDWLKRPTCIDIVPFETQRRTLLLGVLRGVGRVHEFGLTHNDIKPENVLVLNDKRRGVVERAVLCDFELLKAASIDGRRSGFTTGAGGTQPYMAPERPTAKSASTKKSDMYSAGVVMLLSLQVRCSPEGDVQLGHLDDASQEWPPSIPPQLAGDLPDGEAWWKHWQTVMKAEVRETASETAMKVEVRELLTSLLSKDPRKRPDCRDLFGRATNHDSYFNRVDRNEPVYWEDMTRTTQELFELDPEGSQFAAVKEALNARMPSEFGQGHDAGESWDRLGLTDPDDRTVNIVKAWRVQNRLVARRYATALENMADEISCGPPLASENPPVCNRAKIMQQPGWPERPSGCSQGGRKLEHAAQHGFHEEHEDRARFDVNETFLLHGLPKECVDKVVRQGFNLAYSGKSAGSLCE
jgi:serine/threonine protein kinase